MTMRPEAAGRRQAMIGRRVQEREAAAAEEVAGEPGYFCEPPPSRRAAKPHLQPHTGTAQGRSPARARPVGHRQDPQATVQ